MLEEPQGTVPDLWRAFDEIKSSKSYAAGSVLFEEELPAVGVFLIERGQVTIQVLMGSGRRRRLALAGPGTMLGLSEVISGESYKVSAHSVGPTRVFFIEREDLLQFLAAHPAVCMAVVRVLSEDLHSLYHHFRNLDSGRTRRRSDDGRFC